MVFRVRHQRHLRASRCGTKVHRVLLFIVFVNDPVVICASCAGIGSQIYAYNLAKEDGDHLKHTAFEDGTRVHGIHSASGHWGPLLAIHGGRHAKVRNWSQCSHSRR